MLGFLAICASGQPTPLAPATQAEVNAGALRSKFVSPLTLNPTPATAFNNAQTLGKGLRVGATLTNSSLFSGTLLEQTNNAYYHGSRSMRINGTNYWLLSARNNYAFTFTNFTSFARVNFDNPNDIVIASPAGLGSWSNYINAAQDMCIVGDQLYMLCTQSGSAPADKTNHIVRLNPATMDLSYVGALPAPFKSTLGCIASEGTNLFVCSGDTASQGWNGKFTTNLTLLFTNRMTVHAFLETNGSYPHSMVFDGVTNLYLSGYSQSSNQNWLGKFSTTASNLTFISARTNGLAFYTDDSCDAGDWLVYGNEQFNGLLTLLNKTDGSLRFIGTGVQDGANFGNWFYGGCIWSVWASTNGHVARTSLETMRTDVFRSPVQYPNELGFDGTKYIVTGWNNLPAPIATFVPESLQLEWSTISRPDGTIGQMISNGVSYAYGALTTNLSVTVPGALTNTMYFTNGYLMRVSNP